LFFVTTTWEEIKKHLIKDDETSSITTLSVADVTTGDTGDSEQESESETDSIFSLSSETVQCYIDHQLVPLTSADMVAGRDYDYEIGGFLCDSCGFETSEQTAIFDRCMTCGKDYCSACAERWIHF